jgi:zinc D-Ala-D-Ala carboxypeptidase
MDWTRWPNFGPDEFRCKHTGHLKMHAGFMDRLQKLRTAYGKPMRITSGYRDPLHPIEAAKDKPGAHSTGRACDVGVQGADALRLVALAVQLGFTGIGVQQKGSVRFIHLDDLSGPEWPRPNIWSY